jgi:hypothetical protein
MQKKSANYPINKCLGYVSLEEAGEERRQGGEDDIEQSHQPSLEEGLERVRGGTSVWKETSMTAPASALEW